MQKSKDRKLAICCFMLRWSMLSFSKSQYMLFYLFKEYLFQETTPVLFTNFFKKPKYAVPESLTSCCFVKNPQTCRDFLKCNKSCKYLLQFSPLKSVELRCLSHTERLQCLTHHPQLHCFLRILGFKPVSESLWYQRVSLLFLDQL